jgi:predicted ABC-type ATPase
LIRLAKEIFIIGGPNGAGKTTAARKFLPNSVHAPAFLNADEIAREISPENPEVAAFASGRLLLERFRELVWQNESFAFETTCAGRSYVPMLRGCVESGWRIIFYYLWLPSPEDSASRVAKRVLEGGHSIPSHDIQRRFIPGLWNMRHLYLPLADTAAIYDNSGRERILIAEKESGGPLRIVDPIRWHRIEELTP